MSTVNPELRDLQQQVGDMRDRLAKAEGEIQQLNRTAGDTTKQTIWQFVIFTVTMAGVVIGALSYQTSALSRQFEAQIGTVNAQIGTVNARIDAVEKRIDQAEKNMNARFEDLKQEVRASRGR
jgi:peptidoglycan hydrolase CwlO-like protein